MRLQRAIAFAAALVLMAMTLAACGGGDDATDTTEATTTTTAATTTTDAETTTTAATTTTEAPATTAGGDNGAAATEIDVEIQSLSFDKDEITIKAGQEVTIVVTDKDTTSDAPHNFHVRAGDENFFTSIEEAPNTQKLTFTIDTPGTYEFFCDTHPLEMSGTLVVEP